jgi:hypothetical protein
MEYPDSLLFFTTKALRSTKLNKGLVVPAQGVLVAPLAMRLPLKIAVLIIFS